jgi:hypothetical protein
MTNPPIEDGLALLIANDLERGIANLGYLVGMGVAPSPEDCERAARKIVGRIKDRAVELLSERRAAAEETATHGGTTLAQHEQKDG